MGCLHDGHLALIRKANEYGQRCVVSIFVNPLQFGPQEDFSHYPRTLEEDEIKLRELSVDCLFVPSERDLYPDGFVTRVRVGKLSEHLCGRSRPGHFEGVATICLKLFQITACDIALFGEKDFQQLRIIQKLGEDLNLPVTIIPHPTVREKNGLALSSRNRYLSENERKRALAIAASLVDARTTVLRDPSVRVASLVEVLRGRLLSADLVIDYAEVASDLDLAPVSGEREISSIPEPRFFAAAKVGATRLIDNISLSGFQE
jgi:pantoate--beta-alanine ligase